MSFPAQEQFSREELAAISSDASFVSSESTLDSLTIIKTAAPYLGGGCASYFPALRSKTHSA